MTRGPRRKPPWPAGRVRFLGCSCRASLWPAGASREEPSSSTARGHQAASPDAPLAGLWTRWADRRAQPRPGAILGRSNSLWPVSPSKRMPPGPTPIESTWHHDASVQSMCRPPRSSLILSTIGLARTNQEPTGGTDFGGQSRIKPSSWCLRSEILRADVCCHQKCSHDQGCFGEDKTSRGQFFHSHCRALQCHSRIGRPSTQNRSMVSRLSPFVSGTSRYAKNQPTMLRRA
jgi:hypothetical protein